MSAAWSPDGQSLAFLRRLSRGFQLIVRSNAVGSERAYAVEGIAASTPRWLADSSALIVGSTSNESGTYTFQSINVATGVIKPLFARDTGERVRSAQFAVAPDGKSMYLAARPKASAVWTEIVEVELASGTERAMTKLPDPGIPAGQVTAGPLDIGMALGPDGTTLAIQSWTDNTRQRAQLMTVRVDKGSHRHVFGPFSARGNNDRLRWTPDGRNVLFFESDGRGIWRVMRVGAEGGQPEVDVELKNFPDSVPTPSLSSNLAPWSLDVSPDGGRIIFGGPVKPKTDLWALDNVLAAVR